MIRFLALCVIVAAVIVLSVAGAQAGEFSWDDTAPIVTAPVPVKYDPTAPVRVSGNVRTVVRQRSDQPIELAMKTFTVPALVVEAAGDCAAGACGTRAGFRSREVYRASSGERRGLLRWPSILRPLQRLAAFRHRS